MRFLKWATFLLLVMLVVGVVASYPTLRSRFFTPLLAERYSPSLETIVTAESATQLSADTLPPTLSPTLSTIVPATVRPTLALTPTNAPSALLIIASTHTLKPVEADETSASTEPNGELATPPALATTSLLPASSAAERITPIVLAPAIVTVPATVTVTVAAPVTPSTASPIIPDASVPHPEKGGDPESWVPATATSTGVTPTATPAINISVITTTTLTSTQVITPQVITTLPAISPAISPAPTLTVVATVTPIVLAPIPAGPFANANSPLYGGPNLIFPIVGQVLLGDSLTIIGRYTEGTWYLLASGVWIPGEAVDNAPLALPLVFPTPTPVPSATPTMSPTPLPTETAQTSATPTPTPTSLDDAVCDCSSDNRDCLGNIFANRAEAQRCFEYCFRQTGLDIHLLDPNLNGLACENLP